MARMKPERRAVGRWFAAGSIVIVILAGVLALAGSAVNGTPFASHKTVRAEFSDVHSLAVNDDVRENSVRIGRVAGITLSGDRAVVTMELDGNPAVYRDSVARIWDVSALAAKFVELEPGTPAAGPLPDGAVLPAARDESSADVWQVLNIFDPATRAQMASFLREFGGGSLAHGPDLNAFLHAGPALVGNVATVSDSLASPEFDLPRLLITSDTLVGRFQARELQISELIRQTSDTFEGITAGDSGPLKTVLAKAPTMLRTLRPALDDLNPRLEDIRVAVVKLDDGAKSLGDATPELRGFLRDAVSVSHQVPDFADAARRPVGELTGTVRDARPLVHRAVDTFGYLQRPLHVLAPYGPEMGSLFDRLDSFTSRGPEPGKRYATVTVNVGAPSVTGSVLNSSGQQFTDPYPKPGQAEHESLHLGSLPAGIGVGGPKR